MYEAILGRFGQALGTMETYNGKEQANCPHADRVYRQREVIDRLDDRTHLRKGGVIGIVGQDSCSITVGQNRNIVVMVFGRAVLLPRNGRIV